MGDDFTPQTSKNRQPTLEVVVFSQTSKFDGTQERVLTASEMRQIGGRAGRFGMHAERGTVTSLTHEDLKCLRKGFQGDLPDITNKNLIMAPSLAHIQALSEALQTKNLSTILNAFVNKIHIPNFNQADLSDRIELANSLDSVAGASLETKFIFSLVPIDSDNKDHISILTHWLRTYVAGQTIDPENGIKTSGWRGDADLENTRKLITAYRWLSLRFPTFSDDDQRHIIEQACEDVDTELMRLLKNSSYPISSKKRKNRH